MGWFHEWWLGVGLVGQIMICAAVPMTVILLLQLILMIIGADFGGDSDADFDADGSGADFGVDAHADFGVDAHTDFGMDAHADFGMDAHADFDMDAHADFGMDAHADFGMDTDFDMHGDISHIDHMAHAGDFAGSNPHAIRIFTIRGIVAFFALGGWSGLAALTGGVAPLWSVMIALVAGAAAMLLASVVLQFALRMQSSGNINLKYAVSQIAEVYITIPASRAYPGKVTMVLQERFVELDAMTDNETEIRPNNKVEVVGQVNRECLLVRPVTEAGDINQKT